MSGAHSKIGASGMKRWEACPGSVRMSEGVKNEDSEYALEGTVAHSVGEDCLKPMRIGNVPHHAFEFAGEVRLGVEVTEEMCEAVQTYVDFALKTAEKGDLVRVEAKYHLKELSYDLFGTSDLVIYKPRTKTLYSVDYKHGVGVPVEAEGNPQLLYYALGAALEYPREIEWVEMVIIQPRCFHREGPIRRWRVSIHDLIEWSFHLEQAAKATEDPNAPLSAGDHCRWCPAAGFCPELRKTAMSVFEDNQDPLEKYDPAEIAAIHKKLGLVESWIKSVRSFAYREAMAGRVIPHHKVVDGRKSRSFKDREETVEFLRMYGLDDKDIFTTPELKSVAQIEKAVGKAGKPDLKPLVEETEGGKRLVSDDAPGESLDTSAKNAFAGIID